MMTDLHFWAAAIVGTFLLGLGKGGFAGIGLLALPLLSLVIPPLQGAAILLPILMVQDVIGIWAFRRDISWRHLKLMLPGGLIGMAIAYFTATLVSTGFVLVLLGLIAIVFPALQFLQRKPIDAPARPLKAGKATFWGTLSGFTSFIANTGAPPYQVAMLPEKLPPRLYAGTLAVFFGIINYVKFPAFVHLGQINGSNFTTSALLFPLAIVSTLAGVWIVRRVDAAHFYRIVLVLTFLVGLKLTWDGVRLLGVI